MKKRSMRLNTLQYHFTCTTPSYLLIHSLFSFIYILYNMAHQNPFHDPPYSQDYQSSPRPGSGLGYPPTNQPRRGSQYLDPHAADLGYRQQEDWRGEEEDELKPLNS
jgi:hypothetical protein